MMHATLTRESPTHTGQRFCVVLFKIDNQSAQQNPTQLRGRREKKERRTHELKNLRKILQRSRLERSLDQPSSEEVNGFHAILPIPDITPLDVDHADDGVEYGSLYHCSSRDADGDDSTARADVLGSLLEGLFGGGEEDDGVSSQTFWGGCFDVFDDVL